VKHFVDYQLEVDKDKLTATLDIKKAVVSSVIPSSHRVEADERLTLKTSAFPNSQGRLNLKIVIDLFYDFF
jgi:hypothetical protein